MPRIPVIDLFAGPGGLGEGFASLNRSTGGPAFDVRLSIEKDRDAHSTLFLRSFFRSFGKDVPDDYFASVRGELPKDRLLANPAFKGNRKEAEQEAWHQTLCEQTHTQVSRRVRSTLRDTSTWVLIGGPPCQAYSLVGRARMRPTNPRRFAKDERHFLYREYLRIIADHCPAVFVMENVKGLLSSKVQGHRIFESIVEDLSRPSGGALRYRILPIAPSLKPALPEPRDYVVRSEMHGLPQSRHRVILCGVREDIRGELIPLQERPARTIDDALTGLPELRSRISRETDDPKSWQETLDEAARAVAKRGGTRLSDVAAQMHHFAKQAKSLSSTGNDFTRIERRQSSKEPADDLRRWYLDTRLGGVTCHESRGHMRADLHRYFFAASFAYARGHSPTLHDFPSFLLPQHKNIGLAREAVPFVDRFRVQCSGRPATTVVSHIAKDGHYFIHPDPKQCRSLTVREAARIQTFPDNYHLTGTRTNQFVQIGNAVPPLLARQIAERIYRLLKGSVEATAPSAEDPVETDLAIA